ncbi:MAG: antitoxin [Acidimicrobiaceae bacterium]|nr:antitoxin [Acidimicrobiaceae bacterium]
MTDILIHDVPDDVVAAIEANAKRVGLSKAEYLRRTLNRECRGISSEVTVESLQCFSETFVDLADPDVMHSAWS